MALIISSTETQKIKYRGTNIEVPSVYTRINYTCPMNGKSIQYSFTPFTSKEYYDLGEPCYLTWSVQSSTAILELGEEQNLQVVHEKAKEFVESLGYLAEIIDIPLQ